MTDTHQCFGVAVPRPTGITQDHWLAFWSINSVGWYIGKELVEYFDMSQVKVAGVVIDKPASVSVMQWLDYWMPRAMLGKGSFIPYHKPGPECCAGPNHTDLPQ